MSQKSAKNAQKIIERLASDAKFRDRFKANRSELIEKTPLTLVERKSLERLDVDEFLDAASQKSAKNAQEIIERLASDAKFRYQFKANRSELIEKTPLTLVERKSLERLDVDEFLDAAQKLKVAARESAAIGSLYI